MKVFLCLASRGLKDGCLNPSPVAEGIGLPVKPELTSKYTDVVCESVCDTSLC